MRALGLMCLVGTALGADAPAADLVASVIATAAGDQVNPNIAGGLRLTFLYDKIAAWPDVAGSELRTVPDFLKGHMLDVPRQTFPAGSTVRYSCPAAGSPCDAFVFLYECYPCPSLKGALPTYLMTNGWERSRCAPSFVTGAPGGLTHRMTSYRKTVAPGGIETFDTLGDVEWAAFAISPGTAVDCSTLLAQGDCEAPALGDFCRWNGRCQPNTCIPAGPQPGGCPAHVCIGNEWPLAI